MREIGGLMVFPAPTHQKLPPHSLEKPTTELEKPTNQQELPTQVLDKPSQVPKSSTSDGFATYDLAVKTIAVARKTIVLWFFVRKLGRFQKRHRFSRWPEKPAEHDQRLTLNPNEGEKRLNWPD